MYSREFLPFRSVCVATVLVPQTNAAAR
jgi:hypothetical protein